MALYVETLERIKHLSSNSCNCTFNSTNPASTILYGGCTIGTIETSIFFFFIVIQITLLKTHQEILSLHVYPLILSSSFFLDSTTHDK
jgi:hypothetical protein